MAQQVGTLVIVTSFNIGDIICAKIWWDRNQPIFFKASDYDVVHHSGKAIEYIKVIKQ